MDLILSKVCVSLSVLPRVHDELLQGDVSLRPRKYGRVGHLGAAAWTISRTSKRLHSK